MKSIIIAVSFLSPHSFCVALYTDRDDTSVIINNDTVLSLKVKNTIAVSGDSVCDLFVLSVVL